METEDGWRAREETDDWGLVRRGGEYIRDKLRTDRVSFFSGVASLSQTIKSRACRECQEECRDTHRGDGGRMESERRDGRLGISATRREYIRD